MTTTQHSAKDKHLANNFPKRTNCLEAIFSDTSVPCLMRIAENASMPASMLEQLAFHNSPLVREAVADNINTPLDTLWMLAKDESLDVRYAMAENHSMALVILRALQEDENPYVACRAGITIERIACLVLLEPTCWSVDNDQRQTG